jgi:hypothetical protein
MNDEDRVNQIKNTVIELNNQLDQAKRAGLQVELRTNVFGIVQFLEATRTIK